MSTFFIATVNLHSVFPCRADGHMASGTASDQALQKREDLRQALTDATNELAAVDSSLQFRHKRELRSWNDEAPALEVYASAMGQTADVMRGELEKLRSDMHAAMQSTGHVPGKPGTTGNLGAESQAAESLSQEIERLIQHMESIDKQLAEVALTLLLLFFRFRLFMFPFAPRHSRMQSSTICVSCAV